MPIRPFVDLNAVLGRAVELGASDIHLKVGKPPVVRRDGQLGLIPDQPLGKGGLGAWEVAARFSSMDLDFMPGGSGAVAGGVQNIWSVGLNWYPNPTVRFLLDYSNIQVNRASAPTTDISANTIALRSQIAL